MAATGVLDELGQDIIPEIFSALNDAGLNDSMYILRDLTVSDGAGGQVKTIGDEQNDDPIPCSWEPAQRRSTKLGADDKLVSFADYVITFPIYQFGDRLQVAEHDRLKVIERGDEPEKIFRIVGLKNFSGVNFEADCVLEN